MTELVLLPISETFFDVVMSSFDSPAYSDWFLEPVALPLSLEHKNLLLFLRRMEG